MGPDDVKIPNYSSTAMRAPVAVTVGDVVGLTKRELFAAMAMQGLLADPSTNDAAIARGVKSSEAFHAVLVDSAVGFADALLAALAASRGEG